MRSSVRILPSLLLLLLLFIGVPAAAEITLSVGTTRAADSADESGSFGSGVQLAHGVSHATSSAPASAVVASGALPCAPSCETGLGPGAHALAELDAKRMRFAVRALGSGPDAASASASIAVSDTLSLVGWSTPGTVDVTLHVRIELAMDVDRGSESQASAAYTYFLDGPDGGFGDLFAYVAEANSQAVPDPSDPQSVITENTELFDVTLAGEPIDGGASVPGVYETTITIPVAVGPGQPNSFGFVWSVGAGGFLDGGNGQADIASLDSAYLGITVSRGSFVSANGYQYPGYLPEPGMATMLAAGVVALRCLAAPRGSRRSAPRAPRESRRG